MSLFPGDSELFGPLFRDDRVAAVFSDDALIARMVEVEVALAGAMGDLSLVPKEAAEQIAALGATFTPAPGELAACTGRHGVPVIELVRQLREHVGEPAASFLHLGATSQDILDTAMVLQLAEALPMLEQGLEKVTLGLGDLARQHRGTLMVGRTRSQQAVPITFGLKVATWLAPLLRHRARLSELTPRVLVVQLGGAAGTLAPLGAHGPAVQRALADRLQLSVPTLPWHSQRDGMAELGGWLSLVTGSLGKMGQDVTLMTQTEVGELNESKDADLGASSTMPQKRNPIRSEAIVSAARQNATLVGAMHQALVHAHERDARAWQLEWLTLPQMVGLTGGALQNAAALARDLDVHEDRMQENLKSSKGLILSEAASTLLSRYMPAAEARAAVGAAGRVAADSNRHLVDVLKETVEAQVEWGTIQDATSALGSTNAWIEAVLDELDRGSGPQSPSKP